MYEVRKRSLKDFIFPPACSVCNVDIEHSSTPFCTDCLPGPASLLADDYCCPRCQELTTSDSFCPVCSLHPLPFFRTRSMWNYDAKVEKVVLSLKYGGKFSLIPWLASQAASCIEQNGHGPWDLIIPVPSKRQSSVERGYNPVALFSRRLGKYLSVPVIANALTLSSASPSRAKLSIEERASSPAPLIRSRPSLVKTLDKSANKRILLVDDVLTTGVTATAAAKAISNFHTLDLFTIARSSRFRKNRLATKQSTVLNKEFDCAL